MAGWKFFINNIQVDEPIGWDGIEFNAIRLESHGIDQPFSTEITWSGTPSRFANGAKILKDFFDSGFINDVIPFRITSDQVIDGNAYDFNGLINMALYSEKNTCDTQGWEITVGILENDFKEIFKSRTDVDIDLTSLVDLDGNAIPALTEKQIRLHRQDLYLQANGKNLDDSSTYTYNGPLGPIAQRFAVVPTFWQQKDFIDNYGSVFNTNATFVTRANWETTPILKNNQNITRTFNYEVKIQFQLINTTGDSIEMQLYFLQLNGNVPITPVTSLYLVILTPGQTVNVNQTFTGSFTVPFQYTVSLFFGQNTSSTAFQPVTVNIAKGYTINLNEINPGEYASTANCLTIEQWLRRAIYVMTGSNDKLISDTFSEIGNGCYWNNALTNGLRIRQATNQNNLNSLKTTWKKVFEDLDRIFCLGWSFEWTGSEWKIRVEKREYFYNDALQIGNFEKVSNITQMALVEELKNAFIIGYTDTWKNIQLSGVFAIHTDRNYFVANRAMKNNTTDKLDIRSGIIGEGYAIEFSRRLSAITFGGSSSDRPNDYETFIIWLNRAAVTINPVQNSRYNLPQESGSVTFAAGTISANSDQINTSSLPFGGLYNIFHTPARIGLRWWKVLGMNTYGLPNPMLKFQVGQYQTNYSSYIDDTIEPCQEFCTGCLLEENLNIDPQFLRPSEQSYLFKPIGLEFSFPQNLCSFIEMANIGTGFIRVTSGGFEFFGFLESATNKPVDPNSGITDFKLILAKNVPLPGDYFTGDYFTGDYFTGD
jgi:hypothetical protein